MNALKVLSDTNNLQKTQYSAISNAVNSQFTVSMPILHTALQIVDNYLASIAHYYNCPYLKGNHNAPYYFT